MMRKMWAMKQTLHDVLFLHWPANPAEFQKWMPEELELDLYDNKAWLGIVLFEARKTRPRFLPPIPGTANFLEVNVRTYVKYKKKSGVYFFSLDTNSKFALEIASSAGFLPYRRAQMAADHNKGTIMFHSRTVDKGLPVERIAVRYKVKAEEAASTNLEKWLTERYCLWTKPGKRLFRVDIEHEPWNLKYVTGEIQEIKMAKYLGKDFESEPPLAHYAEKMGVRLSLPAVER
ncbi:MAG TPA: DUF2071 domain-containing protein [Planococcus sp. (in: firmicutes)]|nr:DUF2071 domain-containing protein [Planococcus sp. (in: firmicutes)]